MILYVIVYITSGLYTLMYYLNIYFMTFIDFQVPKHFLARTAYGV